MNLSDADLKKYLQLAETATESPDLERVIMQRIQAHEVQQQEREHSFRVILLLAIISMLSLVFLFFYGKVLLLSFSSNLSLPDLSNYTLIIAAFLIALFLFVSIDPILKMLLQRKIKHN